MDPNRVSRTTRSAILRKLLPIALLLWHQGARGQAGHDMGHGHAVLQEAATLREQERNEDALKALAMVHRSDSLYERVLLARVQVHAVMEDNEAVERLCREGIALAGPRSGSFMVSRIAALYTLKRYDIALPAVDSAIQELPGLFRPRHQKVLVLAAMGDKEAALGLAMENAKRFPYQRDAHTFLGAVAFNEGRLPEAALAFAMSQVVRFEDATANMLLGHYDGILGGTKEPEPEGYAMAVTGDDLQEEAALLRSRAAMNKNYKVKPDLTYPMCRQSHLLFSAVQKRNTGTGGFYTDHYGRLAKAIMDEGLFEGFVYHCLSSSTDRSIKGIAVKNKAKVLDFRERIARILFKHYSTFADEPGGAELVHVYSGSDLAYHGVQEPGTGNPTGSYTYYHGNGRKSAQGEFGDAGEREGRWLNWYDTGVFKSRGDYKAGKLDGELVLHHTNGLVQDSTVLRQGARQGESCTFHFLGGKRTCKTAVDDTWNGPCTEYFPTGGVEWTYAMANDKTHGGAKQLHPDGTLHYEGEFIDGLSSGTHVNHHPNGNRSNEYTFVAGKSEGAYRKWHVNGELAEEGTVKAGKSTGELKKYDQWGAPTHLYRYDDQGRLQGVAEEFNGDGTRSAEFEYNKDLLVRYRFYHRDGRVLSEAKRVKGKFDLKGHHPDGGVRVEGTYLDEGAKDGVWKYYFPDGTLDSEESHAKGVATGTQYHYRSDGTKSGEDVAYERNGVAYQSYTRYYPSGAVRQQGQWKGNVLEGVVRAYHPDGNPESVNYYRNGEHHGWQDYYDPGGVPHYSERKENGFLLERVTYDGEGNEYERVHVRPGAFELVTRYPQGAVYGRLEMMNGILHGKARWYFPNGTPATEGAYLNGLRHGPWKGFRPDGKKHYEREYHLGKLIGMDRQWYPEGGLRIETPHAYGDEHGTEREYHRNGKIAFIREIANDALHGRHISHDLDGRPQMVRFYHKGRLTGYGSPDADGNVADTIPLGTGVVRLESRFPNGNVARKMNYRNGELEGPFQEFHENGQLMEEATYKAGRATGTTTTYFANGKVQESVTHRDGQRHGEQLVYWDNGQVQQRLTYVNGELHGTWSFHDRNGKTVATYTMRGDNVVGIAK